MDKLPPYVSVKDFNDQPAVLRQKADEIAFPLSAEDRNIIDILEAKFDAEVNCAGLAAPQIGFNKKVFVFAIKADEDLKKWRPDLQETMPKSIWINPTYKPVGDATHSDYEGCFSVEGYAGSVSRYQKIYYEAFRPDGSKVTGEASGFLARVIQHETDHLNGTLFIDHVLPGKLFTLEEYRKMRAEKMAKAVKTDEVTE